MRVYRGRGSCFLAPSHLSLHHTRCTAPRSTASEQALTSTWGKVVSRAKSLHAWKGKGASLAAHPCSMQDKLVKERVTLAVCPASGGKAQKGPSCLWVLCSVVLGIDLKALGIPGKGSTTKLLPQFLCPVTGGLPAGY